MFKSDDKLSARDRGINAVQAILKGVPYIGASLDHFIFGPLEESRMRRIETTLSEMAEALHAQGVDSVANERFVALLESVSPT